MTEKSAPDDNHRQPTLKEIAETSGPEGVQPPNTIQDLNISDSSDAASATNAPTSAASLPATPTSPAPSPMTPSGPRLTKTPAAPNHWVASPEWVQSWKQKLPLQTIMRMLQVLVPQVEKICIDKGLTDETEILKFLQHGTLVGLLPVPHPILIRKYQANSGTTMWFRTYLWGVIYLR